MCVQVLHLVGMALLEEQQQLENSSGEDHVTFNYTSRITCRQLCTHNAALSMTGVKAHLKRGDPTLARLLKKFDRHQIKYH